MVSSKADLVLSSVSGRESEATIVTASLGDDPVVVVEGLIDSDEDVYALVSDVVVGWLVIDLSLVVSCRNSAN